MPEQVQQIVDIVQQALNSIINAPQDILITVGTVLVLIAFAYKGGKDRIITLIISLYIGLLLYMNFPYAEQLLVFKASEMQIWFSNVIIFLVFVLVIHKIVGRVIFAAYPHDAMHKWMEAIGLAAVASALLLAFVYHALPITTIYDLSPHIDKLFEPTQLFFWWLLAPFIVLFFVLKK